MNKIEIYNSGQNITVANVTDYLDVLYVHHLSSFAVLGYVFAHYDWSKTGFWVQDLDFLDDYFRMDFAPIGAKMVNREVGAFECENKNPSGKKWKRRLEFIFADLADIPECNSPKTNGVYIAENIWIKEEGSIFKKDYSIVEQRERESISNAFFYDGVPIAYFFGENGFRCIVIKKENCFVTIEFQSKEIIGVSTSEYEARIQAVAHCIFTEPSDVEIDIRNKKLWKRIVYVPDL